MLPNDQYLPSELRQALDACNAADDPIIVVSPDIETGRLWRLRAAGRACLQWLKTNISQVIILIVTGVIVAVIVAYLHL